MKPIALVIAAVVGSLSQMAPAASEIDILRNKCASQEHTIKELEKEIDSLHALLRNNKPLPQSMVATTRSTPKAAGSYKVTKGDSMSKIARKHGISLQSLVTVNPSINPNRLSIGQSINLPVKAIAKTTASIPTTKAEVLPAPILTAKHAEVPKAQVTTKDHVVQSGDTLYDIARKHNTSVANILEQNQGINPRKLRPGQSIAIATEEKTTTVVKEAPKVAKQAAPAATPTPKKEVKKQEVDQAAPKPASTQNVSHSHKQPKVRTVSATRQMTFGEFASVYGASVEQINEINGFKLTKGSVLAQGSELYIPNIQD